MARAARLRLGIVGCGRVFERYHLPALRGSRDWEIAAVCDPLPERLARARRVCPQAVAVAGVEELLAAAALDAVLVLTTAEAHVEISVLALERGLDVLVEKPLALAAREAARAVEAAAAANRRLWVGFNRRFQRHYLALREELRAAGGLQSFRCDLVTDARRWPAVAEAPRAGQDAAGTPRVSQGAAGTPRVSQDAEAVLHDVACHAFDLLAWLAGRPLTAVRAAERPAPPDDGTVIEVEARLGDGLGARIMVGHGPRYRELVEAAFDGRRLAVSPGGPVEAAGASQRARGPLATALRRLRRGGALVLGRLAGRPSPSRESFARQLAAFAAAVRGEEPALRGAEGADGLAAAAAVDACLESLAAGGAWREVDAGALEERGGRS